MDSQGVVDRFRSDVDDLATPQLWADDDVFDYLDDAQKMFCRRAWGLGDVSSPITKLAIPIGITRIALSDRVLKVRSAYRTSDGRPVEILNYEDLGRLGLRIDGHSGLIQYLIIGMEPHIAVPYPVPSAVDTVQLVIDRLPLTDITSVDAPQVMEIDSHHHRHLTLWMRHLAYSKQDSETSNQKKADKYEADFLAYCDMAKEEKARAMHKTRVVRYGGIGGAGSRVGASNYRNGR